MSVLQENVLTTESYKIFHPIQIIIKCSNFSVTFVWTEFEKGRGGRGEGTKILPGIEEREIIKRDLSWLQIPIL